MAKMTSSKQRHQARVFALQTLYAWQLSGYTIHAVKDHFVSDNPILFEHKEQYDEAYYNDLTSDIAKHVEQLDAEISLCLDRHISQINPVELSILRMALFEFKYVPELPYKIILNEAIELAKKFGAVDSHKYINGVLDKLSQQFRSDEVAQLKKAASA